MSTQPSGAIEIFYAFVPKDEGFAIELEKHLITLQRKHHITNWHHHHILAGQHREKQTSMHLNAAHIILLFISVDFFSPDAHMQTIVTRAMERHETEHIPVIPILVRQVASLDYADFHGLQSLPRNQQPISQWLERRDEAYAHIAEELRKVIENATNDVPSQLSEQRQQVLHHVLENKEVQLAQEEPHIVLYLQSIEERTYPEQANYNLRWKKYFVLEGDMGGHQLKDPTKWDTVLQRELYRVKEKINLSTPYRLLRVYGASRLCCWFALGYTFRETTGYTIEQEQKGQVWRTSARAHQDFAMRISGSGDPRGEPLDVGGETVALGISVRDEVEGGVRKYLAGSQEKVAALLLVRPERALGLQCLQGAEDAMALAKSVQLYARELVRHWDAKKLLLFYTGPAAGACFIGYFLNAIGAPVQIMEYQNLEGKYIPTFLLS